MSANNYILLKQTKTGWTVSMRDADTNKAYTSMRLMNESQAINRAYEIQEDYHPEYGVIIEK